MEMELYEQATEKVLTGIGDVFDKYVIFPTEEARLVSILWVAHSWVADMFHATPRIFFTANEPASGKTRAAEVTANMGPEMNEAANVQPSMIYTLLRELDNGPTFFIDETDKIWGKYGTKKYKEELVKILNLGFHRGKTTTIGRSGSFTKALISCPVVFSGMGDSLPGDLMTRTIKITMRRIDDDQSDTLEEYTSDNYELDFARIHDAMKIWVRDFAPYLDLIVPDVPFRDRKREVWTPLLSIAALAGEKWEAAAVRAAKVIEAGGSVPMSTRLLFDVENALDKLGGDRKFVFTKEIQEELRSYGWAEKFIQEKVLSNILKPHGVAPKHGSVGGKKGRGYGTDELRFVIKSLR